MNNKIPPPIITLTFGLAIYFSRPLFPDFSSGIFDAIGLIFLILGIVTLGSAVNSFKKHLTDLSDTDEILAMGIEASNQGIGENAEKLQELKNFILEILNRVDAIEKSIMLTDQDLFNLKQVLIYSHTNSHAIPKD